MLLSLAALWPQTGQASPDYNECVGARVHLQTEQDHRALEAVAGQILEDHPGLGDTEAVLCGGAVKALRDLNIEVEITVPDLAHQIAQERQRVQRTATQRAVSNPGPGAPQHYDAAWYDDFKDLPAIETRLRELAAKFPKLVELKEVGRSLENRPLWMLRIRAQEEKNSARPGFLYTGALHAREWISPMTVMYTLEALLNGYGKDSEISRLLDQVDVYAVPVVNPDGYVYTWAEDGDRFWRKNRRVNKDGTFGVDLNRNWEQGFDVNIGSSQDPRSDFYRGTGPFSEPEIAAMRDLVGSLPNLAGYMDLHSYSQMILWGPGYYYAPSGNLREEECMAREIAEAVSEVNGAFYKELPIPSLYPTTGASADWTRNKAGLKSIAVEVRPEASKANGGFITSPGQILPTGQEHMVTVKMMMQWILGELPSKVSCDEDQFDCVNRCHVESACTEETKKLNNMQRGSINTVSYDYHGAAFRYCVDMCEMRTGQSAIGGCRGAELALNRCIARATCDTLESGCDAQRQEVKRHCGKPSGPCGWGKFGGYQCGGQGADPDGKHPMACPADIQQEQACILTAAGCCDADGNAWYCRDDGKGSYVNRKNTCETPEDAGTTTGSTDSTQEPNPETGSTGVDESTQASSGVSDRTSTAPENGEAGTTTSANPEATTTRAQPQPGAGTPTTALPDPGAGPVVKENRASGCTLQSEGRSTFSLLFVLGLAGLRRRRRVAR